MIDRLKSWARTLKRDAVLLWLAARDRRTPWAARLIAGAVAAYALSPIDLIPDFVPVLGYLDDLIIVPAGIWLALRLMPAPLVAELRTAADARAAKPVSHAAAVVILVLWIAAAILLLRWLMRR